MKKTRMEKGITLVALIITIVVLLILAAVAISSIQNDGLIGKVNDAATKWNESVKKEQGILDDYLEFLEVGSDIGILKKYVLGEGHKGRLTTEILSGTTFKDEESTIANASEEIEYLLLDSVGNERIYYIKYNNNIYNIVATAVREGRVWEITTKDVVLAYAPQGREGTQVLYDSNGNGVPEYWTVLTDRNGKLELVSSTISSEKLTIGAIDSTVTTTLDLDGSGEVDEDDNKIASSIKSYNEAIADINNFCKEVTGLENVRSIGANATATGTHNSTQFNSWFQEKNISLAEADTNYKEDYVKLLSFGTANINETSKKDEYWYASRYTKIDENYEGYYIRIIDGDGVIKSEGSLIADMYGPEDDYDTGMWYGSEEGKTLGVRPVIINPELKSPEDYIIGGNSDEVAMETAELGDINGDGTKDAVDIGLYYSIRRNEYPLTNKGKVAADINQDNIIDDKDQALTVDIVSGVSIPGITSYEVTRDASKIKISLLESI